MTPLNGMRVWVDRAVLALRTLAGMVLALALGIVALKLVGVPVPITVRVTPLELAYLAGAYWLLRS